MPPSMRPSVVLRCGAVRPTRYDLSDYPAAPPGMSIATVLARHSLQSEAPWPHPQFGTGFEDIDEHIYKHRPPRSTFFIEMPQFCDSRTSQLAGDRRFLG